MVDGKPVPPSIVLATCGVPVESWSIYRGGRTHRLGGRFADGPFVFEQSYGRVSRVAQENLDDAAAVTHTRTPEPLALAPLRRCDTFDVRLNLSSVLSPSINVC